MYQTSIFIFRRDLRIEDNIGLYNALKLSREVVPCFIFDPVQVEKSNSYRSLNCIAYMLASLYDLDEELHKKGGKLFLFYGNTQHVIGELTLQLRPQAVFVNRDYTPFSKERDKNIKKICDHEDIDFKVYGDTLLHEPEELLKQDGRPYQIFTPFYKKALEISVERPHFHDLKNYRKKIGASKYSTSFEAIEKREWATYKNNELFRKGGRREALGILANLKQFKGYEKTHDLLYMNTTGLSAPNKFGTVSIREVYHAIKEKTGSEALLRQLYWRDFFTHIAYYAPFVFGHAFKPSFDDIAWNDNETLFKRWCSASTGFPIVDAAMTQLITTGYMHNRARLIVGSFLTKDMHIDWKKGERFFAQFLVDYDPCVNNGNWQWVASTGSDAQPYFRIFNPWTQQKKFDSACTYIKQWLPAFRNIAPERIHNWDQLGDKRIHPLPILDHAKEAKYAQAIYKKAAMKF